jgi:uncharacterized protein YndB with AHSA1/START domain
MRTDESLIVTLPTDREIALTRVFDAPRKLVFDALTTPALLKRWLLGPPGWTMPVCEIDLRVGGRYRYEWRHVDGGQQMGMGGVYREIVEPKRIVCTEKFDQPWYEGEGLGRIELVEKDGKTTLTQTLLYISKAVRDSVLKSPMEGGVRASYNQLAELLAKA